MLSYFFPTLSKTWNPTPCWAFIHCITIISALTHNGLAFNGWMCVLLFISVYLVTIQFLKSGKSLVFIQWMERWMDGRILAVWMDRWKGGEKQGGKEEDRVGGDHSFFFVIISVNYTQSMTVVWKNCKLNLIYICKTYKFIIVARVVTFLLMFLWQLVTN